MDFCYHLVHRKLDDIRSWAAQSDLSSSRVCRVIIPLKEIWSGHFALAVIRRDTAKVDMVDSRWAQRTFVPLFLPLFHFARALGSPWPLQFELNEWKEDLCASATATNCALLVCYHAFLISQKHSGSFVPYMSPTRMHEAFITCLKEGKLEALKKFGRKPSSPTLTEFPPIYAESE